MQIVRCVISFYKVIHEYKVRKWMTLSTLQGASTFNRPTGPMSFHHNNNINNNDNINNNSNNTFFVEVCVKNVLGCVRF